MKTRRIVARVELKAREYPVKLKNCFKYLKPNSDDLYVYIFRNIKTNVSDRGFSLYFCFFKFLF